jgi:hypothetical protein
MNGRRVKVCLPAHKTSKNLSPQLAKAIGIPLANMYPDMLVLLQPMRHLMSPFFCYKGLPLCEENAV